MRKITSLLLTTTIAFGYFASACVREDTPEETTTTKFTIPTRSSMPSFEADPVDVTIEFDTVYVDEVDTPWVLENNIPFAHGNVTTYFNQFVTTGSDRSELQEVPGSEVYNNQGILARPTVTHYPAEQDGYTVYEINYSEYYPMSMYVPEGHNARFHYWYHDVQFLDYYTGIKYPYVALSGGSDSYLVTGDVVYNGETYTVSFYCYRESEFGDDVYTYDENGTYRECSCIMYYTNYIIVPNGYDGIVMYIYTADDSDLTLEEELAYGTNEYTPPEPFGLPENEEYIQDHAFISIAELG